MGLKHLIDILDTTAKQMAGFSMWGKEEEFKKSRQHYLNILTLIEMEPGFEQLKESKTYQGIETTYDQAISSAQERGWDVK